MAIAFIAETDGVNTGSCSTFNAVVTKPAGVVDGSVMVVGVQVHQSCCGAATSVSTPTGWVQLNSNAYSTADLFVVFRRVSSGDGAVSSWNFVVTPHSLVSTTTAEWFNVAYSGVDNTTPIDATTTVVTNTSSTNLTEPSITTASANGMVLGISAYVGTGTVTDAATTTRRTNRQNAAGSVYCAEKLFAAAGSTGTIVPTIVGAKVSRGIRVALRPASDVVTNSNFLAFM